MRLPERFALLDDSYQDPFNPLFTYAYLIVRSEQLANGSWRLRSVGGSDLALSRTGGGDPPLATRVLLHSMLELSPLGRQDPLRVNFWPTGWTARLLDGSTIPVMDLDTRRLINWEQLRCAARDDTMGWLRARQTEQSALRTEMLRRTMPPRRSWFGGGPLRSVLNRTPTPVPMLDEVLDVDLNPPSPVAVAAAPVAPAVPAALHAPAAPLPRFVAELIKRDAIAQEQSCPISFNPFEAQKQALLTSCCHLFEPESYERWAATNPSCPVCKQEVMNTMRV